MRKKQAQGKVAWVDHETVMKRNLSDPKFRYYYQQRRLTHEVALAVRGMRVSAGLTQAQLAKRIGVKQPMIARIERGIGKSKPSWTTLHRIVVALGGQFKLSFMTQMADEDAPLVELDGRPPEEMTSAGA